jgi:hypothetical protein
MAQKKPASDARILSPSEYPAAITAPQGAYTPKVVFAAQHPLGLFHITDDGVAQFGVYFTSRRAKHAKLLGWAPTLPGAFRRISAHEDTLIHPEAPREEGKHGPVSIRSLGQRTGAPKPKSQLDHELSAWLAEHGYAHKDRT